MKEIELRNRLKVARAEKELTQQELADLVGVTRQTISSIENGQYTPSARLALLIEPFSVFRTQSREHILKFYRITPNIRASWL